MADDKKNDDKADEYVPSGKLTRPQEFNPGNHCTEFISQQFQNDRIYTQTDIMTPESLKYFNYLETLGDEETFNIPSARNKAYRLATMLISYERQGRTENVVALVGHPQQPGIVQLPTGLNYGNQLMPGITAEQPKKKHWWSRGR